MLTKHDKRQLFCETQPRKINVYIKNINKAKNNCKTPSSATFTFLYYIKKMISMELKEKKRKKTILHFNFQLKKHYG